MVSTSCLARIVVPVNRCLCTCVKTGLWFRRTQCPRHGSAVVVAPVRDIWRLSAIGQAIDSESFLNYVNTFISDNNCDYNHPSPPIRPISLTPIASKHWILNMVNEKIEDNINRNQFGGMGGASTTDALVEMIHR